MTGILVFGIRPPEWDVVGGMTVMWWMCREWWKREMLSYSMESGSFRRRELCPPVTASTTPASGAGNRGASSTR